MPYHRRVRPDPSRHTWSAAALAIAIATCLACGSANPSAGPATASVPATAAPATAVAPSQIAAPSPTPTPRPTPSPTASPTPRPTSSAFWAAVVSGLGAAGTLEIGVEHGRVAYTIEYTSAASASAVGGQRIFVCLDGHAYDGQSGWVQAPGTYSCGAAALREGFLKSGQAVDSWGSGSGVDQSIGTSVTVLAGGLWRWTYQSVSPLSGDVHASLTLDPRTHRLRSGTRSDATGPWTYSFRYGVAFPTIAVPAH